MSTSAAQAGIDATNRSFEQAAAGGDAAGMAAIYTEGGQILPPNGEIATGRTAIQTFWQAVLDMGIQKVTLETRELEVHGDTAWEVGKGDLYAANDQLVDTAKYIVVWKQEDGVWRWHRDIWNSNNPA